MGYVGTRLRDDITIDELFSMHYFEYTKGFAFEGESHDFWEFVYADKGEVIVTAGDRELTLSHGDSELFLGILKIADLHHHRQILHQENTTQDRDQQLLMNHNSKHGNNPS